MFKSLSRSNIIFTLQQYFYWLGFFAFTRIIFIFHNRHLFETVPNSEIFKSFWQALPLDRSASGYLMALPVIITLLMNLFGGERIGKKVVHFFNGLFTFIIAMMMAMELPVFDEWQTRLNYRVVDYIKSPGIIVDSTGPALFFQTMAYATFLCVVGFFLYRYIVVRPAKVGRTHWLMAFVYFVITAVGIVWAFRGSLTESIPISQSDVYFSKFPIVNTATVNGPWNFLQSLDNNKHNSTTNPFAHYMPREEANAIVDSLLTVKKDTTVHIFNQKRPNIVFVLMESFSADLVEQLGGYKDVTPVLDTLIDNGLLFTNCISSATRTDQGISGTQSGYPAQPHTSIVGQLSKHQHLPSITNNLQENGYYASAYYGGQLSYVNVKAWMFTRKWDRIVDEPDIKTDIPKGSLGYHEEVYFDRWLADMDTFKLKKPFYNMFLTISTHSPFDQKSFKTFHVGRSENGLLDGANYTDHRIGEFLTKAQQKPWYKNTIFVFMADHSRKSPREWPLDSYENRLIPFIIYGEPLKKEFKGKKIDKVVSQIDVTTSLLKQLDIHTDNFPFSKNVFNPYTPEYAYFSSIENIGWATPNDYLIYNIKEDTVTYQRSNDPKIKAQTIKHAKAYTEYLLDDYLKR